MAGKALSNMQLQKLTYIAHGFAFPLLGSPLTYHSFQAWQHGPVAPKLYDALKQFGDGAVVERIHSGYADPEVTPEVQQLIDAVWNAYGHMSASELRDLTHLPGSPWHETPKAKGSIISDELTRDYYTSLIRQNA